jgi:competence protein ComEC
MNAFRGHWEKLIRQRLPFLPLVAAACAGCLVARFVVVDARAMAVAAGILLGTCALLRPRPGILCLGIFSAFAALQTWKWHEAPARMFADAHPGPVVATIEGRVEEAPVPSGENRWLVRVASHSVSLPTWSGPLGIPVQVSWPGEPPQMGDKIRATGSLASFRRPRNPGEFDVKAWRAEGGVFSRIFVTIPEDAEILAAADGFSLRRMAWKTRQWVERTLTSGLDPGSRQAQLILAMTLGETRALDDKLLEDFRQTGTFHLFSVSGLHVGMLGVLLWIALGTIGLPRAAIVAVIIPALFYYALVTGWKPASVRASVMAAFVLVGILAGRPPTVINSLLAAAFFILLCNTNELFNAGFQLSFSVVFTLVILAGPVTHALQAPLRVDPFIPPALHTRRERLREAAARAFAPVLAVAVVAWIGSVLLTVEYFHLLSVYAVLANVLCVPLAFVAMAVAMLSLAGGLLSSALAALFNNTNWLLSGILIAIVEGIAALPGSAVITTWPEIGRPEARIVVFDFGRGGAAAIQTGRGWWLLDAGPVRFADRTLLPCFRQKGVARLEGMILTHGDAQHLGGAEAVVDSLKPREIYESVLDDRSPTRRTLREKLAENGTPIRRAPVGEIIETGHASFFEILYPPVDIAAGLADDKALVVVFEAAGWRVLFLSDAGTQTLEWLKENSESLRADVVVSGAHSRGGAVGSGFLKATGARVLIAGNAPFPSRERLPISTRQAALAAEVDIVTLDTTGALTLSLRPDRLTIVGFYDDSTRELRRSHGGHGN